MPTENPWWKAVSIPCQGGQHRKLCTDHFCECNCHFDLKALEDEAKEIKEKFNGQHKETR
jgi:hypothetical protein